MFKYILYVWTYQLCVQHCCKMRKPGILQSINIINTIRNGTHSILLPKILIKLLIFEYASLKHTSTQN